MRSPGEWAADPRVDGARRWLTRFQPFLITALAIALIAIFLPGHTKGVGESTSSEISAAGEQAAAGADTSAPENVVPGSAAQPDTSQGGTVRVKPDVLTFAEARKKGVELVANCDTKTGNVMVPSRFAPPCTQRFTAPNGGKSWRGVDSKFIDVVWMHTQADAASDAILKAAGVNDPPEKVEAQVKDWTGYFQSHYNMWGRTIRWHYVMARGTASDDAAARADAIDVANKYHAFAAINAPNNTFVNEVVARGIMCICTVSQPIEAYIKWYPYVWTTLLASSQGYIHRATYAGDRLAGGKAQWAYDGINPTQNYKNATRKFGFIWYETDDHAYVSGAKFFIKYMKQHYNIDLSQVNSSYVGYPNHTAEVAEEARPIIQKMKNAGVTTIICACDPFAPIFFTQEATRQLYGPEWMITGSALTDTSFFARLYDQDQWAHAFGVSYLAARLPQKESEAYRILKWQYSHEPPAKSYGVIGAPLGIFWLGLHTAGPVLTPKTFAAGLEGLPIRGRGGITTIAQSYGDKGIWPWKIDPVAADDATEIWWDRTAHGEDEIGQDGDGLYRYMAMGKRYLPNEWPHSLPLAFNTRNTVTIYPKPPAADQWPCYNSPATHRKDRC